jgi:hypothetical protein
MLPKQKKSKGMNDVTEKTRTMKERESERTSHDKEQRAGRLSDISSRIEAPMNNKNSNNNEDEGLQGQHSDINRSA